MIARLFNTPRRSPPQGGEPPSNRSNSIYEYEDFICGFVEDIPLISLNNSINVSSSSLSSHQAIGSSYTKSTNNSESTQLTLRQVLRASVGVMGESPLGMTEKVVLSGGKICVVKRLTRLCVRKREFGRRIESIARLGNQCQHLVPITAYLYAKRIKLVVCDYYPMGSLSDLLSGARERGQTALEWKHRFIIIQSLAKAIAFIHSQNPPRDHKNLQTNMHGNIKSSNVMINIDFSARLSDYGIIQVAGYDAGEAEQPAMDASYNRTVSQTSDVYNFGVVLLDVLGWPDKDSLGVAIKSDEVFEFSVEGREQRQAWKVLDIALSCTHRLPDARPSIHHVLSSLDVNIK